MQAKSCLTLEKYIVKTMNFSINESFTFDHQKGTIELVPEFARKIKRIDNNSFTVELIFQINNEKNDMPFSIKVNVAGVFRLDNWEFSENSELIKANTAAILFPYLRALVSMITTNANIPPYTIPVMNIAALFERNETDDKRMSE